jgi:hypothetical protein
MRPIYETDADRTNQQSVGDYVESVWNCKFVKSDYLDFYDGQINYPDGRVGAYVEIKTRKNASNRYPTYMMSANKWKKAIQWAEQTKVPFFLFVKFTDGVYGVKLKKNYKIELGGRYDRGDSADVEKCVFIPMEEFKKI